MPIAKLTTKGQITIPKEVREGLGVSAGDKLRFTQKANGEWAVLAANGSVKDMRGMLSKPAQPVSLEAMTEAVREGAAKRFRRSS